MMGLNVGRRDWERGYGEGDAVCIVLSLRTIIKIDHQRSLIKQKRSF